MRHQIPVNTLHPSRRELQSSDLFYGGFCPECNVWHELPSEEAIPKAKALLKSLMEHRRIDFEAPVHLQKDSFKTDALFDDYGKMFGVLIAQDSEGNKHELKAFSYGFGEEWICDGWANPMFDYEQYIAIREKGNAQLYPMTDEIQSLALNTLKRNILVKKRREISQQLMQEYLNLYHFKCLDGQVKNVRDLYYHKKQLPMGTGDCCAPKLIAQAHSNNWTPLSIAEFYFGNPGKDGTRFSGQFYSSCEVKCHPILGRMLCSNPYKKSVPSIDFDQFYPKITV